ncbi:MAG: response regulator [Actinomycetota bacterium]
MDDPTAVPQAANRSHDGRDHERPRSRVATILFPHGPASVQQTQPRILVVDDNHDFRESLVALLVSGGMQVVGEASTGREALEQVESLLPDVVLMDVRMPHMDGVETTRRLKEAHPLVRVVAVTAQEDDATVREMLVAGASGYVTKNSDGDDILDAVTEAAAGGAVLSPTVTPAVIEQLTEALESERQRGKELEEAHLALVERVGRRHELVSRMGHELRTPVTVILGLAKTIANSSLGEAEQAELLERLVARAAELAKFIERFEGAMDAAAGEFVDVGAMVRAIASEEPRLHLEVGPDLPAAWANTMLARRVLEELVDNACRFSEADRPIRIELGVTMQLLTVRVIDRGPGIAETDRDRIFEPLEQGEALDARTHQGAGVGLSLAQTAARAMDGDLVLESTGPDGSTFLWTLPLASS